MKTKFYTLLLILIASANAFAGFIDGSMTHQNRTRIYRVYVPDIYAVQNKKVPLLIGLHGFGDDVQNFSGICMSAIADTANYIVVYPEATPDPILQANAWNSGASAGIIVVNNGVDDKGFLNRLIDTMIARYMIDTTRMYMFGFSFGGFMTNRMAAECSSRFAAVASVSGLRGNSITALPQNSMPYLHFHGTSDQTIGYYGTSTLGFLPGLGMSAESTVKFWAKQNHCDSIPVIDSMPDIANDGLRFVRFTYDNGIDNSKVIFYKVINGTHSWYGLPSNDISYCQTIWSFFRQYSRLSTVTSIRDNRESAGFKIYPNPSKGIMTIDFKDVKDAAVSLNAYNAAGSLSFSLPVKNEKQILLDNHLPAGIYLLQLMGEHGVIASGKIVVE
jgi:polyhydroxybutyrate depolymerase